MAVPAFQDILNRIAVFYDRTYQLVAGDCFCASVGGTAKAASLDPRPGVCAAGSDYEVAFFLRDPNPRHDSGIELQIVRLNPITENYTVLRHL